MQIVRPLRTAGISEKDIGGEILLYAHDAKAIHVLNPTAKLIWDHCDGKHTSMDIAQILRQHFAIPDNHDVVGDVEHTLATFASRGLLQTPSDQS